MDPIVPSLALSPSLDPEDSFSQSCSSLPERGFTSQSWKLDSRCFVCQRQFSRLGVHRHHCRFCGRSVCDTHSSKRRKSTNGDALVRICDECDKAMVGHAVTDEYSMRIFALRERLRMEESRCRTRAGEMEDVIGRTRELQGEKKRKEKEFEREEKELEETVGNEERIAATYGKVLTSLKSALSQSTSAETICSHSVSSKAAELSSLQSEVQFLTKQIAESTSRVDSLHLQSLARIPKASLELQLCPNCLHRIAVHSFISDRETSIQSIELPQLRHNTRSLPVTKSCKADCSVF